MSWSASFRVDENGEVVEGSEKESNTNEDYTADQYEELLWAVWTVLRSGVVGAVDGGRGFNVVLSGHGNPNHSPTAGWSNDCVTMNIYQL